ncbi:MAG: tripartite tricarboxylate transporter substrate binding protein [Betaproteobacteria bacterium]|nr:tripartite tricarboxylate transporter substrate binding protein [Betaproteobacteria bacterium]
MRPTLMQVVMRAVAIAAAVLPIAFLPATGFAQKYPDRPVRIIVPSGAGGGYDLMGRAVARKLSEQMGENFFVENRVGAGTIVGTQAAANAAPDGHTLLVGGPSNLVFNAGLYKNLPYDPAKDFVSVNLIVTQPYTLLARGDIPHTSVAQIVDAAKRSPGKLSIATAGAGTGQHLGAVFFLKTTGTDMLVVHYKSAQQVFPDLIASRVDLTVDTLGSARTHVDSGKVKLIAMASTQRTPLYPQVPTIRELGYPDFSVESWIGLFAPMRTPSGLIDRLRIEIERTMKMPDFRAQMEGNGAQMIAMSGRESESFVKSEIARWTPLIRQAGITAD